MKNTWSYGLLALALFGFFAFISSSHISQQGVGAADKEYIFLVTKCVENTSGGSFFTKPEIFVDVSFDIISLPQNVTVVSNSSRRIRVTNNTIGLNNFLGISFFSEKYPNISFDEYKNKIDWRVGQGVSCPLLTSDFTRSDNRPTVPAGGTPPATPPVGSTPSISPFAGLISKCSAFVEYPQVMVVGEMKNEEKFEFKYTFCLDGRECGLRSIFINKVSPEILKDRISEAVKNDILSKYNDYYLRDFKKIEDIPDCEEGLSVSGLEDAIKKALAPVAGVKNSLIVPVPDPYVPSPVIPTDAIDEIIREARERQKNKVDQTKPRIGYVPNKCESFISNPQKEGERVASLFINGERFKEYEKMRGLLTKDQESAYLGKVAIYIIFLPTKERGFSAQVFDFNSNKWDQLSVNDENQRLVLDALGDRTYVLVDNKPGTKIADFTRIAADNNLKLADFIKCVVKFDKDCKPQNKPAAVNPIGQQQVKKGQYILFTDPQNCGPCRELEHMLGIRNWSSKPFGSHRHLKKYFDSGEVVIRSDANGMPIPSLVSSERGKIENKVGPTTILDFLESLDDE